MRIGGKESNMKIDGRCHCGYITYEAEIDPEKVVICHCTDCQTLSGSAFRTVALTRENTFKLLSGQPKVYLILRATRSFIPLAFRIAMAASGCSRRCSA